jgi:serine/threonine protein kinase
MPLFAKTAVMEGVVHEYLKRCGGVPNLIPMYSVTRDGDHILIKQQQGGEDMRKMIERTTLAERAPTLRTHMREVLACVAHMHRCGVVHMDLNASNVVLIGGHAHVIDLGYARFYRSARVGSFQLTRVYANSPEASNVLYRGYGLQPRAAKLLLGSESFALGQLMASYVFGTFAIHEPTPAERPECVPRDLYDLMLALLDSQLSVEDAYRRVFGKSVEAATRGPSSSRSVELLPAEPAVIQQIHALFADGYHDPECLHLAMGIAARRQCDAEAAYHLALHLLAARDIPKHCRGNVTSVFDAHGGFDLYWR